ncbi:hypothetical protein [Halorhabdus sp. BNX81]|uniref:hypothetical protein n=1 Tax=Halorhabdus sp. BNX81 TaxID=2980181 RepID=UPI0023DD5965|nr:hypothetical protein [Halorhabdus sp. BNX81]WEL22291.1 Fe2+/Zn2+ uptake regulation protein, fur/PerR [Halorhabdus sp. BNX81]
MSDATRTNANAPFEEQREMYELLSQETRHLVLQYVLAHPDHLPSLAELAYLIPKNKAAIRDQIHRLCEEEILSRYDHPPNEDSRDLPSQFYGLTTEGVEILEQYNYLRGLGMARALYDNTRLSERARRHRDAPRPELPEAVDQALRIDSTGKSGDFERLEAYIRDRNARMPSVDDQVEVATALARDDIGPDHDGIKRAGIVEQFDIDLDFQPNTVLKNLLDIDILEEQRPPGPDIFAISERKDEIVNGNVTGEAKESLEALIEHIDDELHGVELDDGAAEWSGRDTDSSAPSVALADGAGRTVRSILATTFNIDPERVVEHLRSGNPVERLNTAVEAIESSEAVTKSEEYGRIVFVYPTYRYRLSQTAMELL